MDLKESTLNNVFHALSAAQTIVTIGLTDGTFIKGTVVNEGSDFIVFACEGTGGGYWIPNHMIAFIHDALDDTQDTAQDDINKLARFTHQCIDKINTILSWQTDFLDELATRVSKLEKKD